MKTYQIKELKEHRGSPRLWLQGAFPERAGFVPGVRYGLVRVEESGGVALRISQEGDRVVSRKDVRGKIEPVIDINSRDALSIFEGVKTVRVVVLQRDEILILPTATDKRISERTERFLKKMEANEPLSMGALAFGAGVLDHAVHTGMTDAGVPVRLGFANEIRDDLVEQAVSYNDIVEVDTVTAIAPMQEMAYDDAAMSRLPKQDIIVAGLSCSGASVAGKAKRGISHAEEHPLVGHLVVAACVFIAKLNPMAFVLENVPQYSTSASSHILRNTLRDMGYTVHEREMLATEWGDLERRKRWCLVAVSRGVDFDFEAMFPAPFEVRTLASIMEKLEDVEDRWSEMPGLKAKQERDIAAGKGFMMQLFDGSETSINTLTKGITKNRSTDPKFVHPHNPDLLRNPTAREHARAKGIPERFIEGLSQTTAHELLGQSICYSVFRAVGKHLGAALRAFYQKMPRGERIALFETPTYLKVAG